MKVALTEPLLVNATAEAVVAPPVSDLIAVTIGIELKFVPRIVIVEETLGAIVNAVEEIVGFVSVAEAKLKFPLPSVFKK